MSNLSSCGVMWSIFIMKGKAKSGIVSSLTNKSTSRGIISNVFAHPFPSL